MKTKILFLLLAGGLLALAAWYVQAPNPSAQASEIPEKYRETVDKGLEYLVKNQHKDGHWEGDDGKHPVAMTGLVGLALLMERERLIRRGIGGSNAAAKYSASIRKAADWLRDKSQAKRDGLLFSEHPSETARYMQGHGLATLFLAGAFEEETDEARRKKLTEVLTRAIKYIVKAQSTQGGWYDTSKVEGHDLATISATVIQVQALQAADNVGVPIPREAFTALSDGQEYLKTTLEKEEKAKKGQSSLTDRAGALSCRYNSNPRTQKDEWIVKWFKSCQDEIPMGRDLKFGRDELTHYYYAQIAYSFRGDTWSKYRTSLFDQLQASQNKDGSWPASEGISVGPVYATALWCTVLQLDKRSHPASRRDDTLVTY